MKKQITLFIMAFVFLYAAFASNYYLFGYWFRGPTRILMITLCMMHVVLFLLSIKEVFIKPADKGKSC